MMCESDGNSFHSGTSISSGDDDLPIIDFKTAKSSVPVDKPDAHSLDENVKIDGKNAVKLEKVEKRLRKSSESSSSSSSFSRIQLKKMRSTSPLLVKNFTSQNLKLPEPFVKLVRLPTPLKTSSAFVSQGWNDHLDNAKKMATLTNVKEDSGGLQSCDKPLNETGKNLRKRSKGIAKQIVPVASSDDSDSDSCVNLNRSKGKAGKKSVLVSEGGDVFSPGKVANSVNSRKKKFHKMAASKGKIKKASTDEESSNSDSEGASDESVQTIKEKSEKKSKVAGKKKRSLASSRKNLSSIKKKRLLSSEDGDSDKDSSSDEESKSKDMMKEAKEESVPKIEEYLRKESKVAEKPQRSLIKGSDDETDVREDSSSDENEEKEKFQSSKGGGSDTDSLCKEKSKNMTEMASTKGEYVQKIEGYLEEELKVAEKTKRSLTKISDDETNICENLSSDENKGKENQMEYENSDSSSYSLLEKEQKNMKQKRKLKKTGSNKEIKKTPINEESYGGDSKGSDDENVEENSADAALKRKEFSDSSLDDSNSKENLNLSAKKTGKIRKKFLDDSESSDSDSISETKMKSLKSKQQEAVPKKSKKKSRNSSKTNSKIERLKKFIRLAGIRIQCYNKLWKNCKSDKAKMEKLMQMLVDAGLKGTPTIEKCKKLLAKRERKEDLKSLDLNNIINSEDGRPKRNTRSFYANIPSKPLEENRTNSSSPFSRIKYLLDSEESD